MYSSAINPPLLLLFPSGVGPSATFHFRGEEDDDEIQAVRSRGPSLSGVRASALSSLVVLPEVSPADAQLGFGFALEDSVKLAVQASWNVIKSDADAIGRALFSKLFARSPALLRNFGFRDVPNYMDSRALKARCS